MFFFVFIIVITGCPFSSSSSPSFSPPPSHVAPIAVTCCTQYAVSPRLSMFLSMVTLLSGEDEMSFWTNTLLHPCRRHQIWYVDASQDLGVGRALGKSQSHGSSQQQHNLFCFVLCLVLKATCWTVMGLSDFRCNFLLEYNLSRVYRTFAY